MFIQLTHENVKYIFDLYLLSEHNHIHKNTYQSRKMTSQQDEIFYINKPKETPSYLPLSQNPYQQRKGQICRTKLQFYDANRYECICGNQYLSYTALYHHVKKHHKDFLQKNRHFASNNSIIMVDSKSGMKIRKILLEKVQFRSIQDKRRQRLRGQQLRNIRLSQRKIEQKYKLQYTDKNVIARQRLCIINLENQELDRKIELTKRKINKTRQITLQMSRIIESYQKIMAILKIGDIVKYYEPAEEQQKHSYTQ